MAAVIMAAHQCPILISGLLYEDVSFCCSSDCSNTREMLNLRKWEPLLAASLIHLAHYNASCAAYLDHCR